MPKSHFERMADKYSYARNWKEFIRASFGDHKIQVTSGQGRSISPNGIGSQSMEGYGDYAKNYFEVPSNPRKIDKLMGGVIARFSYPNLYEKIVEKIRS